MGLFERRKAQVTAAPAPVAQARSSTRSGASGAPASSGAGVTILNPSTEAEVDRLLSSAGPARGVVITARHDMATGDRPIRTRVHVSVRPRLHGGALGDEAALTAWVGWKVAALLEPGLEIPIQFNRTSGRVDAIATDLLSRELAPRDGDAKQRHPGVEVGAPEAPAHEVALPPVALPSPLRPPIGPALPGPVG